MIIDDLDVMGAILPAEPDERAKRNSSLCQLELDAPVLGAPLGGAVVGHRIVGAGPARVHALALHPESEATFNACAEMLVWAEAGDIGISWLVGMVSL